MPAAPPTRRRFLRLLAAQTAAGLAVLAAPGPARAAAPGRPQSWKGVALGLESTIQIHHEDSALAKALLEEARAEALRLGDLFSLFNPQSALSQLNARGSLRPAPRELLHLAAQGVRWGELTEGAFDITIHPVCELLRQSAPQGPESFREPAPEALKAALELVDYRQIRLGRDGLRLERPGAKMTLNALAQGYITDQVAALLARRGVGHTLVDIGERRTLGAHPSGRPWRVGLESPEHPDRLGEILALEGQSLAVSGAHAEPYSADARRHHLIEAATGASARRYASVIVRGPDATTADALATALHLVEPERGRRLLERFPAFEARFVGAAGED